MSVKHNPLRFFNHRWQVLLESGGWITCRSKADAETLASSSQLAMAAMASQRKDAAFRAQLVEMAQLLEKYERRADAEFFRKAAGRAAEETQSPCASIFDSSLQFPTFVLVEVGDHVVTCVMDLSSKSTLSPVTIRRSNDQTRHLLWFTGADRANAYRRRYAPRAQSVPIQNAFQALALFGNHACDGVIVNPPDDQDASNGYVFQEFCGWVRGTAGISAVEEESVF